MDEFNEKREEQSIIDEVVEQENVIETETEPEVDSAPVSGGTVQGTVHIAEDVIMELAKKTLLTVPGVQPANPGIASKLGIGRKASDGIRVAVEEGKPPIITLRPRRQTRQAARIATRRTPAPVGEAAAPRGSLPSETTGNKKGRDCSRPFEA